MKERSWEKPMCFVCDFWWLILAVLILLLIGLLTRTYWLPLLGIVETAPGSELPGIPTTMTLPTSHVDVTPDTIAELTLQPTQTELYGYTNSVGGYGFNYPAGWITNGEQNGSNIRFNFPDIKIEVIVNDATPDNTYEKIQNTTGLYSVYKPVFLKTNLDGQEALQEDIIDNQHALRGRYFHILKSGKYYMVGLTSNMESAQAVDLSQILPQFNQLVQSFRSLNR